MEKDFETLEEERQERLADELNKSLDGIFEELNNIREIIENEEEGGELILELESIRDCVQRILDSAVG